MNGYIKLERNIAEKPWYTDENAVRLYLHLSLTVNFRKRDDVPAGSRMTSIVALSLELDMSVKTVRTALEKLVKSGDVKISRKGKRTMYTVPAQKKTEEDKRENQMIFEGGETLTERAKRLRNQ